MAITHYPRKAKSDISLISTHYPRKAASSILAGTHFPRKAKSDILFAGFFPRKATSTVTDIAFAAIHNPAGASLSNPLGGVSPTPTFTLTIGGVDLTQYVDMEIGIETDEPWNGKATIKFTLGPTYDGNNANTLPSDLIPPGYGAFAGKIKQHNRTTANNIIYTSTAGGTSDSMTFLPTKPSSDGRRVTWGGEDCTALLEVENKSLPDVILARGDIKHAQDVLTQNGAAYGVTVKMTGFPNYLIREYRRQDGTPLEWCDKIAKPFQAGRTCSGTTITYTGYDPSALNSGWALTDIHQIQMLQLEQLDWPRDQFTISRLAPVAALAVHENNGVIDRTGGQYLVTANNLVTLPAPVMSVFVQIVEVTEGTLTNFVYKDPAGQNINLTVQGPFYISQYPIASFTFDYIPAIGPVYVPHYKLIVRGAPPTPGPKASAAAASFTYTLGAGLNPEWRNIEDPILANPADAQASCQAHLDTAQRRGWMIRVASPFYNALIKPGQTINVTDYKSRVSGAWFVERIRKFIRRRAWGIEVEATQQ